MYIYIYVWAWDTSPSGVFLPGELNDMQVEKSWIVFPEVVQISRQSMLKTTGIDVYM